MSASQLYKISKIFDVSVDSMFEDLTKSDYKKVIKYDMVIFDESDMFKNSQTVRFKNVKKWIDKIPNVFILTATPTPNTIEDLWSQIYLIDNAPYRLGKNITAFRREYGEEVRNGDRYIYYYLPAAVTAIMEKVKDMCEVNLVKPKDLYPQPKIRIIKINPDPDTAAILAKLEKDYVVEIEKEIIIDGLTFKPKLILSEDEIKTEIAELYDHEMLADLLESVTAE